MPDPEKIDCRDDAEDTNSLPSQAKNKNDAFDDDVPEGIIKPLRDHFRAAKEDVDAIIPDLLLTADPTLALARCTGLAVTDTMRQIYIAWHVVSGKPISVTHLYQFLFNYFHLHATMAKLANVKGQVELWPKGSMAYTLNQPGTSTLHAGLTLSKNCLHVLQSDFPIGFKKKELLYADQFDEKVIKWMREASVRVNAMLPVTLAMPDAIIDENSKIQNALQFEYDAILPSKPNLFKHVRSGVGKASSSWQIRFRGHEIGPIKTPMAGFGYIAYLLRYPDRYFNAVEFELISNPIPDAAMISNEGSSTSKKSGEPAFKGQAASNNNADYASIKDVSKKKSSLEAEISSIKAKLISTNDDSEKEILTEALKTNVDAYEICDQWLKEAGKPLSGSDSTRARQRINQKIKEARKKIRDEGSVLLADHLDTHISSSENSFSYRSDPSIRWEFD